MLFWLLRESGCSHDVFSNSEMQQITGCMEMLDQTDAFSRQLNKVQIDKTAEVVAKQCLTMKKKVFATQTGTGIDFIFPIFDKAQSIFIDTEAWFSNKEKRLEDVKNRFLEKGHEFTVIREGAAPIFKTDNFYYEAVPTAINVSKLPIQGLRLRRYFM